VSQGRSPSFGLKVKNLGQLDDVYVPPSRTDRLRFYRWYARGHAEFNDKAVLVQIDAIRRSRHQHWLECGGTQILETRRQQGKRV